MNKTQDRIINSYITYVSEHQKQPKSIGTFVEGLKLKEETFYSYFKTFEALEIALWENLFEQTIKTIEKDDVYAGYSVNEKLLSFYYTWIENLKEYRSYTKYVLKEEKIYELYPACFTDFKKGFEAYVSMLITEGLETEEIASRKFITDKYVYLLWYEPISILKFWVKDESELFEDTDALIEKTVNFSFDLMRSNGLDSFFDLAKFHIQHFKL